MNVPRTSIVFTAIAEPKLADSRARDSPLVRSAEFFSEPHENIFGPADVTKAIHVQILDYLTYESRATLLESLKRVVNVVHGEHNAEVA